MSQRGHHQPDSENGPRTVDGVSVRPAGLQPRTPTTNGKTKNFILRAVYLWNKTRNSQINCSFLPSLSTLFSCNDLACLWPDSNILIRIGISRKIRLPPSKTHVCCCRVQIRNLRYHLEYNSGGDTLLYQSVLAFNCPGLKRIAGKETTGLPKVCEGKLPNLTGL